MFSLLIYLLVLCAESKPNWIGYKCNIFSFYLAIFSSTSASITHAFHWSKIEKQLGNRYKLVGQAVWVWTSLCGPSGRRHLPTIYFKSLPAFGWQYIVNCKVNWGIDHVLLGPKWVWSQVTTRLLKFEAKRRTSLMLKRLATRYIPNLKILCRGP